MEAASFYLPLCGRAGLGQGKDIAESPTAKAPLCGLLMGLLQACPKKKGWFGLNLI